MDRIILKGKKNTKPEFLYKRGALFAAIASTTITAVDGPSLTLVAPSPFSFSSARRRLVATVAVLPLFLQGLVTKHKSRPGASNSFNGHLKRENIVIGITTNFRPNARINLILVPVSELIRDEVIEDELAVSTSSCESYVSDALLDKLLFDAHEYDLLLWMCESYLWCIEFGTQGLKLDQLLICCDMVVPFLVCSNFQLRIHLRNGRSGATVLELNITRAMSVNATYIVVSLHLSIHDNLPYSVMALIEWRRKEGKVGNGEEKNGGWRCILGGEERRRRKSEKKVGGEDESRIRKWKVSSVLKRHAELTERLSRDSDKMIFERLQREFEAARASQTQEVCLDREQWNDGLLATIRERVHMEAERKAMQSPLDASMLPITLFHDKITYKVGTKVICCLEGARIGIQYETSFAGEVIYIYFDGFVGEPREQYHCVLESKSFLEKMTVLEHTVPFFLPIREAENDLLSSNAMKFIDHIGDLLQAYVDRREQVRLIKDLYGNQIGELYHSLPYHMIEFIVDDFDCVVAWPMNQSKKSPSGGRKGNVAFGSNTSPMRLSYAEDALRTLSLPEAYAEIVLNLPEALEQNVQPKDPGLASA
ncbi:Centromere protein Cenp-O [Cynara cardunculus var. scolymus]|uniref:Centromere protein Cenp-O n=1 Tax=Cynara cardunculus var. scolymus TaxID=59895 RepID=A0A103XCB2_CYNCS|nr:Centromere protein Cenp-O [Cynara cardunculus var. scolymus]